MNFTDSQLQDSFKTELSTIWEKAFNEQLLKSIVGPQGYDKEVEERKQAYIKAYDKYHGVLIDDQGRRYIKTYLGDSTPSNKFA